MQLGSSHSLERVEG
uniref:Uncharacterized protein n=1 Tax=Anguilla anguilla TaxID=7936 RepID=A0A0E9UPV7_ANGAN